LKGLFFHYPIDTHCKLKWFVEKQPHRKVFVGNTSALVNVLPYLRIA